MVLPTVKQEDVPKLFPKGVTVKEMPSGKSYMRFTPQPEWLQQKQQVAFWILFVAQSSANTTRIIHVSNS